MSIVGIKTLKDFTSIIFCKVFRISNIGVRISQHWCLSVARRVLSNNLIPMSDIFILKSSREDLENSLHKFLT